MRRIIVGVTSPGGVWREGVSLTATFGASREITLKARARFCSIACARACAAFHTRCDASCAA